MKRLILLALILIPLTVAALSRVRVETRGFEPGRRFTVNLGPRAASGPEVSGPRIRLALNLFGRDTTDASDTDTDVPADADDDVTDAPVPPKPPAWPRPPARPRAPRPPVANEAGDTVLIHDLPAAAVTTGADPLAVVTSPMVLQILISSDDVAGAAGGDLAQLKERIAEAITRAAADARHASATAPAQASAVREQLLTSGKRSSEDRALADLQKRVESMVSDWLVDAGVPADWQPPAPLVQALLRGRPEVELVERRDYADLYQAQVTISLDPAPRARLVQAYRQEVAGRRFAQLGAGLVFVLASLGLVAGYIHTDEATRGYYTNRLRAGVLLALGAGGAVLYRVLA